MMGHITGSGLVSEIWRHGQETSTDRVRQSLLLDVFTRFADLDTPERRPHLLTSIEEGIFTPVTFCLIVYLFDCQPHGTETLNRLPHNLVEGWDAGQEGTHGTDLDKGAAPPRVQTKRSRFFILCQNCTRVILLKSTSGAVLTDSSSNVDRLTAVGTDIRERTANT